VPPARIARDFAEEEVAKPPDQARTFLDPVQRILGHGGQYNTEGNRIAGPPVRALDRYEYSIINGQLVLDKPYSVAHTYGEGKDAEIHAFELTGPGQHVDGVESWLYPIQPPGR